MGRGGETFWRVGIHCCGCVATVAFTAHNNACSASRIHACPSLPSPPVAGNGGGACLLVQVMGDWLSAARFPCRRFPFRFSSSAVSSLLFLLFSRAPTSNICPLMNNEQPQRRERLSKNQQTERIAPPRFDRHSSNWFILCRRIRFEFGTRMGRGNFGPLELTYGVKLEGKWFSLSD